MWNFHLETFLSFIISCYGSKYGFQFVHAIYEKLARVYILYIQ